MKFNDAARLAKVALKQPWLYDEKELQYIKKAKKLAQKALKLKHMKGEKDEF
jgi:hypothetical protein